MACLQFLQTTTDNLKWLFLQRPTFSAFLCGFVFIWASANAQHQETTSPATSHAASEKVDPFALFDGKSLSGWEGDSKYFRVESDSVVAGRLDENIPANRFLCTDDTYSNFILTLEVKAIGKNVNGGIQFRSKRVENSHEVAGYQCDVGIAWERPIWGSLYDESRRNKMLAEPTAESLNKHYKPDDWNRLEIHAGGRHIEIYLNGEKTVDYLETDESIAAEGCIALQIHGGPPCEVWYRNIQLRKLP